MQQLLNFFIRNKNVLFFLFLFFIAIGLTIQSHSYHKSKFLHSANGFTGGIYNATNGISQFFSLKDENAILLEENNRLKELLLSRNYSTPNLSVGDSIKLKSSTVIKNSYALINNYIILNKGEKDSIAPDLGVMTSNGIVGVIDKVSNNYARVISILNTTSSVNAKLQNSNHFGELKWDGKSVEIVQLVDLPKQAVFKKGDTISTSGRSIIFPKGIPIGSVEAFELDETENFYNIDVRLFNDMTNLGHAHIILNKNKAEIEQLEANNE